MVGAAASVPVSHAWNGSPTQPNALGMRPIQKRAYEKRGEQAVDDWALYDNAEAEPVMLDWGENQ
jgi:hypothetical protein